MIGSNKTVRGAALGPRIRNASRAATRCCLWLLAEGAVTDDMAQQAAEELWLLCCEVDDALKTKRAELALGEVDVSRETSAKSTTYDEDTDVQAKIPY